VGVARSWNRRLLMNRKLKKGREKVVRKVDRKMRLFGETDTDKKTIRVNPRKGELLNTILHEELHLKHPKMTETNIKKKAKAAERKLTPRKAINLLKRYERSR
jgi:hypothetical protein